MTKPKLPYRGPASRYEASNERILEFSGGLISFRNVEGQMIVQLYELDDNVRVRCPERNLDNPTQGGSA